MYLYMKLFPFLVDSMEDGENLYLYICLPYVGLPIDEKTAIFSR